MSISKGTPIAYLQLLARVEGENIFTLFRVTYEPKKVKPDQVVDRVRRQVRAWGKANAAGQRAYADTNGDFNWGDLAQSTNAIPWRNGIVAVEAFRPSPANIVPHDERLLQPRRKRKTAPVEPDSHRRNPAFCAKCGGECYFDDDGRRVKSS